MASQPHPRRAYWVQSVHDTSKKQSYSVESGSIIVASPPWSLVVMIDIPTCPPSCAMCWERSEPSKVMASLEGSQVLRARDFNNQVNSALTCSRIPRAIDGIRKAPTRKPLLSIRASRRALPTALIALKPAWQQWAEALFVLWPISPVRNSSCSFSLPMVSTLSGWEQGSNRGLIERGPPHTPSTVLYLLSRCHKFHIYQKVSDIRTRHGGGRSLTQNRGCVFSLGG